MNRDFKGIWIPREIWLAKDLSCQEKCLWAEIHSLYDRNKGGCYASNEYLVEFLNIKERRLQEMMANLKEKGWVVQVSFDGRTRVIKAVVPPENFNLEEGAHQRCGKVHPSDAEKCMAEMSDNAPLPLYRDNTIEQRLDNSLKVLIPPDSKSAKASEIEEELFKNLHLIDAAPEKRSSSNFSPQIRELGQRCIKLITQAKEDWPVPKNLFPFLTQIDLMIRRDKRDPEKLINVLAWALSDHFWADKMIKPNPVKYLRERFDQLEMKMNAKPPPKNRKFAPCSTGNVLKSERFKEFREGAL